MFSNSPTFAHLPRTFPRSLTILRGSKICPWRGCANVPDVEKEFDNGGISRATLTFEKVEGAGVEDELQERGSQTAAEAPGTQSLTILALSASSSRNLQRRVTSAHTSPRLWAAYGHDDLDRVQLQAAARHVRRASPRIELLTLSERLTLVAHTSLIQDTPWARPGGG